MKVSIGPREPGGRECERDVAELLRERRGQVEAFCAGFTRDHDERDDLAQLVMIRIWRGYSRFDGRSTLSTWLYQVVRNTAATEYRRRASRPVPVEMTPTSAFGSAIVSGPEDGVVDRDLIERALRTVNEPFRHAVELVDGWGCSPSEVAVLSGVPETTVRTRLHRGRRSARHALVAEAA